MRRQIQIWFVLSLALGVLALVAYSRRVDAPLLMPDSYQYLTGARNILSHGCFCTWLAHFDEQVDWGRMPVPFTHFSLGYPLAIAGLGRLGLPLESGGYALAILGYLLVICLLWDSGLSLKLEPWCIALICVTWSLNFMALDYGSRVLTETLFCALFMAVVVLIARDLRDPEHASWSHFLLLGILAGLAYWLKQAGLFLTGPVVLYLGWRCWRDRRVCGRAAVAAAIAILSIGGMLVRNVIVTGTWWGGFVTGGRHADMRAFLISSVKAPYHIVFGTDSPRFIIWAVVLLISGLTILWRIASGWRRSRSIPLAESQRLTLMWIAILAGGFAGGVTLAAMKTIAADTNRYYFPLFPVLLLGAGMLFQLSSSRIGRIAAGLCVLSIVMINMRSITRPHSPDQHVLAARALAEKVQPGLPVRRWMDTAMSRDDILLSTNGQAVHYLLGRPVVSILPPSVSNRAWDEDGVRNVMRHYHASYFLLFPGAPPNEVMEQEFPFLKTLIDGQPPGWLSVAVRTPGTILYQCGDCR